MASGHRPVRHLPQPAAECAKLLSHSLRQRISLKVKAGLAKAT
jgi:hypothetical protein